MKKIVSLLLVLCLACVSAAALAEAGDLVGDWYGSLYGMAAQLTLNEDGSYVMSLAGNEIPGNYELKDGIVYMDDDNPDNGFVFDGTSLVNETQGVTLTRDQADVPEIELAEVNPDAAVEDFEGDWVCKYMSMKGMTLDITQIPLESLGATQIPSLKVEGSAVTLTGMDSLAGADPLEMTFADGALIFDLGAKVGMPDLGMSINVLMLQDGMVDFNVNMGDEIVDLYFAPADAEAEAPAA